MQHRSCIVIVNNVLYDLYKGKLKSMHLNKNLKTIDQKSVKQVLGKGPSIQRSMAHLVELNFADTPIVIQFLAKDGTLTDGFREPGKLSEHAEAAVLETISANKEFGFHIFWNIYFEWFS